MCLTTVVYNTPMNTIGVGDPVPFGINSYGSGDRFDTTPGSKSKNKNKKILLAYLKMID